jgi:hypothetical protein
LRQLKRNDIKYLEVVTDEILLQTLGYFDFGLILYSQKIENYFSYNITGKVTSYLMAGLPTICLQRYTSMVQLVEEKKLGLYVNEPTDIEKTVSKIKK